MRDVAVQCVGMACQVSCIGEAIVNLPATASMAELRGFSGRTAVWITSGTLHVPVQCVSNQWEPSFATPLVCVPSAQRVAPATPTLTAACRSSTHLVASLEVQLDSQVQLDGEAFTWQPADRHPPWIDRVDVQVAQQVVHLWPEAGSARILSGHRTLRAHIRQPVDAADDLISVRVRTSSTGSWSAVTRVAKSQRCTDVPVIARWTHTGAIAPTIIIADALPPINISLLLPSEGIAAQCSDVSLRVAVTRTSASTVIVTSGSRVALLQREQVTLSCVFSSSDSSVEIERQDILVTTIPTVWPEVGGILIEAPLQDGWFEASTGRRVASVNSRVRSLAILPTVSSSTRIVLQCKPESVEGCFLPSVRVWIGPEQVPISSLDGGLSLMLTTPAYSVLCNSSESGECGWFAIRIANQANCTQHDLDAERLGGCLDGDERTTAGFRFGEPMRVFYTSKCVGFEEPGPTCLVDSSRCAFGSGDSCRPCPRGAVCPGGSRAWPVPGYWSSAETSLSIAPCSHPATERCAGWSQALSTSVCGVGFRGERCQRCTTGYFVSTLRGCAPCPTDTSAWLLLQPIAFYAAVLAGLVVSTAAVLKLAERVTGRSRPDGLRRVGEFALWALMLLQTVVQTSKGPLERLPLYLATLFELLRVFEFSPGVAAPLACLDADPLVPAIAQMSLGLILSALLLGALAATTRPVVLTGLITAVVLITPLITSVAFSMLACVPWDDHREAPAAVAGNATRLVLATLPDVTCSEGLHGEVAHPLALTTLVVMVGLVPPVLLVMWRILLPRLPSTAAGLPTRQVADLGKVRNPKSHLRLDSKQMPPSAAKAAGAARSHRRMPVSRGSVVGFNSNPLYASVSRGRQLQPQPPPRNNEDDDDVHLPLAAPRAALGDRFRPFGSPELDPFHAWWRQIHVWTSVALAGFANLLLNDPSAFAIASSLLCCIIAAALVRDQPFVPGHRWKLPLKAGSLLLSAISALMWLAADRAAADVESWGLARDILAAVVVTLVAALLGALSAALVMSILDLRMVWWRAKGTTPSGARLLKATERHDRPAPAAMDLATTTKLSPSPTSDARRSIVHVFESSRVRRDTLARARTAFLPRSLRFKS